MRAFATWSWLVATTGTALMLAPHWPLVLAQVVVDHTRKDTE